jgi:hypothetical protein
MDLRNAKRHNSQSGYPENVFIECVQINGHICIVIDLGEKYSCRSAFYSVIVADLSTVMVKPKLPVKAAPNK